MLYHKIEDIYLNKKAKFCPWLLFFFTLLLDKIKKINKDFKLKWYYKFKILIDIIKNLRALVANSTLNISPKFGETQL